MGYFSQRKNKERLGFFIKASLSLLGLLVFCSFFDNGESRLFYHINSWRLQYHLLLAVVLVITISQKYVLFSFLATVILIANYFAIGSKANIFTNISNKEGLFVTLDYDEKKPFGGNLLKLEKEMVIAASGRLDLAPDYDAFFIKAQKSGSEFVFIAINFRKLNYKFENTAFNNLAKFIAKQDFPVVILGNFGSAAWSKNVSSFLENTGLEVKNRIVLPRWKNLLEPPKVNVLGYNNVGIRDIKSNKGRVQFFLSLK